MVELAWKNVKQFMGTLTRAPKDVTSEIAQSDYIERVAIWLASIDMRNLSPHTYKEGLVESYKQQYESDKLIF